MWTPKHDPNMWSCYKDSSTPLSTVSVTSSHYWIYWIEAKPLLASVHNVSCINTQFAKDELGREEGNTDCIQATSLNTASSVVFLWLNATLHNAVTNLPRRLEVIITAKVTKWAWCSGVREFYNYNDFFTVLLWTFVLAFRITLWSDHLITA